MYWLLLELNLPEVKIHKKFTFEKAAEKLARFIYGLDLSMLVMKDSVRRLREEMGKTDPPDLKVLYRAGVLVVLSRDMNTLSWACQVRYLPPRVLYSLLSLELVLW